MTPLTSENLAPLLRGKRVLLGITGSIAAFKACDIIRFLRASGAEVRVVLTASAERFVTPLTLETLSGHPVFTSLWGEGTQGTHHIDSARWADLLVIAPATANSLAKLAHGLADDLLSTEALAFRGPIVVAPAMNPAMFENPATQNNLNLLRSRGVHFAGPTMGLTSCGEEGEGRMLEPEQLLPVLARALGPHPTGRRWLITLGPTQSALDPVRYLTNRSSGLMGAAMAWAAWRAGHEVQVVAGPTQAELPPGIEVDRVKTATQMFEAASHRFEKLGRGDVFVSAAAVLDWDVRFPSAQKLKKEAGAPTVDFERTPDILGTLAGKRNSDAAPARGQPWILGFAAETQDVRQAGIQKLAKKGCQAVFANDVSSSDQGFESPRNGGWWITADETVEIPAQSKTELAQLLVRRIDAQTAQSARPPHTP